MHLKTTTKIDRRQGRCESEIAACAWPQASSHAYPIEPRRVVVEKPSLLVSGEIGDDCLERAEDLVVGRMQSGHWKVAGKNGALGAEGFDAGQHHRTQAVE